MILTYLEYRPVTCCGIIKNVTAFSALLTNRCFTTTRNVKAFHFHNHKKLVSSILKRVLLKKEVMQQRNTAKLLFKSYMVQICTS